MNWKKYVFFLVGGVICAIIIYALIPTDEKQIRKIINSCEKAIISEDIDILMKPVSYNYTDDFGNGYLQVKKIMESVFKRLDNIEIEKNITGISVRGNLSEVELAVRVVASAGEERGYIIGDAGSAGNIKVFFEKSSNKWLITKVSGISFKQ